MFGHYKWNNKENVKVFKETKKNENWRVKNGHKNRVLHKFYEILDTQFSQQNTKKINYILTFT